MLSASASLASEEVLAGRTFRSPRLLALVLADRRRSTTALRLKVLPLLGRRFLLLEHGIPVRHDALELVAETLRGMLSHQLIIRVTRVARSSALTVDARGWSESCGSAWMSDGQPRIARVRVMKN